MTHTHLSLSAAPVRGAEAAPPAHATSGSGSSSASSPSSLASMPFVNQARQMMSAESGYAVVDDDITVPLAKVVSFSWSWTAGPTGPAKWGQVTSHLNWIRNNTLARQTDMLYCGSCIEIILWSCCS